MADIQYDPACVDCRRDNGRDLAGTTWQCAGHVLAERDWLRAKLANVMVEWEHDVEVLTKERNAALTLAEQRGAAYDMTWREVESLRDWKDKLEAERDALLARLAPPAFTHWTGSATKPDAPPADAAAEAVREAAKEVAPQLEGFCVQAETEARPPGGQQAGLDKSWASRVPPSVLTELRWYAREFRRLLAALDAAAAGADEGEGRG